MDKQTLNKFLSITSTLFDSTVGIYQVCDSEEKDEYFKHFIIIIFKDRKPHTIYGIKDKKLGDLLYELQYLYQNTESNKEENNERD